MELKDILSLHNAELLASADLHTADDVLRGGTDALEAINGIGPKTAEDIYAACKPHFSAQAVPVAPVGDGTAVTTGPTIEEATEAAEADQERLDEIVPLIAAGLAVTNRLCHPSMRFRDEWELVSEAERIGKTILTKRNSR